MPLILTDEQLAQAGLTADQARLELACRLFDAEILHLWPAAQMAGMGRAEFEEQLRLRRIAVYRPTIEDIEADLKALDRLGI